MLEYRINAQTLAGKKVTITAPVEGYHEKLHAPILGLKMMTDEQWEALARKQRKE